ncbi:unnamed protein product [Prunus brigantina]
MKRRKNIMKVKKLKIHLGIIDREDMSLHEIMDDGIEEVLDFKDVPQDKRVPLVATRFRGRATAWWQQLKQT